MVKKRNAESGHIFYAGPLFHEYLVPLDGITKPDKPWQILPAGDMEFHSHCAMYFARCAHLALLEIPEQVTLEEETDLTVHLRPILDNLLIVYGLVDSDDIEKVVKLMPLVRRIAFMRNVAWSDRFQAWLDSAGRAYNEVTREPEALNRGR
jgi:hypothetical protein